MRVIFLSLAILLPQLGFATPEKPIPEIVHQTLQKTLSNLPPDANMQVSISPIADLYQVTIGTEILYITADGKYIITGNIIDSDSRENLTDNARNSLRAEVINAVPDTETVIFAPDGEIIHTLNIFTDTDCGFCIKLHQEIPELNKNGIAVRYLAFPRSGVGSKTYQVMQSIWCADDTKSAMNTVKAGQTIPNKTCKNPIAKQHNLGQQIGVSGTPAMILPSGELLPGYIPAARLVPYLQSGE